MGSSHPPSPVSHIIEGWPRMAGPLDKTLWDLGGVLFFQEVLSGRVWVTRDSDENIKGCTQANHRQEYRGDHTPARQKQELCEHQLHRKSVRRRGDNSDEFEHWRFASITLSAGTDAKTSAITIGRVRDISGIISDPRIPEDSGSKGKRRGEPGMNVLIRDGATTGVGGKDGHCKVSPVILEQQAGIVDQTAQRSVSRVGTPNGTRDMGHRHPFARHRHSIRGKRRKEPDAPLYGPHRLEAASMPFGSIQRGMHRANHQPGLYLVFQSPRGSVLRSFENRHGGREQKANLNLVSNLNTLRMFGWARRTRIVT
ncbi:hypothetical protein C8R44DRAFT_740008 [Mycena epipterygia]|nr:hypothetical protein C8R44DRAFT_740008 [Mycena epipterygia]